MDDLTLFHPEEALRPQIDRDVMQLASSEPPTSGGIRSLVISWACHLGGVESALLYRLRTLNELGHETHAYFYYEGQGLGSFRGIPCHVSSAPRDLANYIRENQFDVITFVNTLHNLNVLRSIAFHGRVLFEFHGETRGIVESLETINTSEDRGAIQGIVVPSAYVATIARRYLPRRPELPIFIARNTLDTNLFSETAISEFVDKYDIPLEYLTKPLVGWVGRIDPNKNWRLLLRIFQNVRMKYPDTKMLVCTNITRGSQIQDFKQEMNFRGFKEATDYLILTDVPYYEMPFYYNVIAKSGGVLLSTSRREGYPYHLLEAQACSCPVICSAIGGSKEIVQHNQTGLVFSLHRNLRAVTCVRRIFGSMELRNRLIDSAKRQVSMTNDIPSNISRYVQWLNSIVNPNLTGKV